MTHDHLSRYRDDCPTCTPSLVTDATWLDRLADWVDRDPLVALGWAVVLLAVVVFFGVPFVQGI